MRKVAPRRRTVLLVEDDESTRRLIRVILEQQGYTVIETDKGSGALKICKEYRMCPVSTPGVYRTETIEQGKRRSISRVGTSLGLLWRRLQRCNRYLCHVCGIWWAGAEYDPTLPKYAGDGVYHNNRLVNVPAIWYGECVNVH